MPRLKLDIFSPTEQTVRESAPEPSKEKAELAEAEKSIRELTTPASKDNERPKFVPVGFYVEHLRLLDEAVLKLRRGGYWRVSKSSIIRSLIRKHADQLDEIWLDGVNPKSEDQSACQDKGI